MPDQPGPWPRSSYRTPQAAPSAEAAQIVLGRDAGLEDRLRRFRAFCAILCLLFGPLWAGLYLLQPRLAGLASLLLVLSGALLGIATLLRHLVRVDLVADRERNQLLLRRRCLLYQDVVPLSGMEELYAAVAAGELPQAPVTYWWDHTTLVLTRDGTRYRAARFGESFVDADHYARQLAKMLEIEHLEGRAEQVLDVRPGPDGLLLKFRPVPVKLFDGCLVVFWGLFVCFGTPLALAGLATLWP